MRKKRNSPVLVCVTLVFVAFVCGLVLGRTIFGREVTVQINEHKVTVPSTQTAETTSEKININTASAKLLDTLPGIGPVIAQRIVDYREANGPFQEAAAIANVEGIGADKLMAIIDLICVEG